MTVKELARKCFSNGPLPPRFIIMNSEEGADNYIDFTYKGCTETADFEILADIRADRGIETCITKKILESEIEYFVPVEMNTVVIALK